ncbi:ABC transporter permease [Paraburkholderia sp. BCC1885]|uniref:ABC transporter permease n=1 Tax=Paraburkholderia sp. BCC1885 TaxID=2562669 RepID=UPI0016426749|nr:ABC transporter permease [Paraburkholderia sp. BCC1885]
MKGISRASTPLAATAVTRAKHTSTVRRGRFDSVHALQGALLPIGVVILWQLTASLGYLPEYLSSPLAVFLAFDEIIRDGELATAVAASLYRGFVGFALGSVDGVLIGLAAGLWKPVRNFFDPVVAFFNPIPKIAFLPVFLLLLGLGHGLMIAIVALSVFFPSFLASRDAVASINPNYVWSAQNMGASRVTIFFRVILPATAPQVFVGLRIGLSMTFVMLFASELISAQSGLGWLIEQGENAARYDLMLAGIVAFAVLGFISDRILLLVRARVLRGQTVGTLELQRP